MEVSAEAKRIMVVALGKLYSSRSQRGGLRLHRSLLLTLVMKSARDMYHAAQTPADGVAPGPREHQQPQQQQQTTTTTTTTAVTTEPNGPHVGLQGPASLAGGGAQPRSAPREEVARPRAEDKENRCPSGPAQLSRKRRGKAAAEPDFLPRKKAKLEQTNRSQHPVPVSPVLMDYVNCGGGSELGARPTPIPLPRAVAAC
ncbi:hypothetical protein F2P81_014866 [Scophthalmus maximus]|uniref:Uncharacterized protein n=1 Tax=Scophthalmus maximus TaxID=52904 RepID=A0A6A4SBM4_SCOMX|nr:hypothetical protein F2P81_014866 [Scophthalmus maximus]